MKRLAMYWAAESNPAVPTPRPSLASSAKNVTCARMRSADVPELWAATVAVPAACAARIDAMRIRDRTYDIRWRLQYKNTER